MRPLHVSAWAVILLYAPMFLLCTLYHEIAVCTLYSCPFILKICNLICLIIIIGKHLKLSQAYPFRILLLTRIFTGSLNRCTFQGKSEIPYKYPAGMKTINYPAFLRIVENKHTSPIIEQQCSKKCAIKMLNYYKCVGKIHSTFHIFSISSVPF